MIKLHKELNEQGINLKDLPIEIWAQIAYFMDTRSLSIFGMSSKTNLQLVKSLFEKHLAQILNINLTFFYYSFFLYTDQELYACGDNEFGTLGLGDIETATTFQPISNITGKIRQVVTNNDTTFVITDDGLFGCGKNEDGQLGIGNTEQQNFFKKIKNIKGSIQQVIPGDGHTLVLTDNGLYGCGNNECGQLGFQDADLITTFKQLQLPGKIKKVATEYLSTFVLTDQGLFVCGVNEAGQLGLGDTANRFDFTKVENLPKNVVDIFAGYSCAFLQTNEGVYACGNNNKSQLGLGDTENRSTFTKISMVQGNIKQIISRFDTTFILSDQLYVFGKNFFKFGFDESNVPSYQRTLKHCVNFHPYNDLKSVHNEGSDHVVVRVNDALFVCGENTARQLGLEKEVKIQPTFFNLKNKITGNIQQVAAGFSSTIILTDEALYVCGANERGELGLDNKKSAKTITKIENLPEPIKQRFKDYQLLKKVIKIASQLEANDSDENDSRVTKKMRLK